MKTKSRVRPMVVLCTSFVCLLIACQLYEPFTEEEVFKGAYERNFVRQFGPINQSQDWDFSNDPIPGHSVNNNQTRAGGWASQPFVPLVDGYYVISPDLISKMSNLGFTEQTDKSFALEMAANDSIEIFPLYQTSTNSSYLEWYLQIFVDDQNITSTEISPNGWKMSTGMQHKRSNTGRYENLALQDCSSFGMRVKPIIRYANLTGHSSLLYFNLYINGYSIPIETHKKLAPKGTQQSSLNRQMRIIDLLRPVNLDVRYDVMFVACEAANFDANNPYDKPMPRYQSLVFMIVGPRLPKVLQLQQGVDRPYVNHTIASKRYMIEDLGSSSDFDFNDVVLDVEQFGQVPVLISQEPQPSCNNAIKTSISLGACSEPQQTVSVRHLCGTRPFQFGVGDYESAVITDPTDEEQTLRQLSGLPVEDVSYFGGSKPIEGWNPDQTIPITGWLPDANNITLKVWRSGQEQASEGGWRVQFPQVGAVPFIMALPASVSWSAEGVNFTGWQQFVP